MDTLARASPSTVISTTVMCVAWASSGTSSSPRHCPASTITASFTCASARMHAWISQDCGFSLRQGLQASSGTPSHTGSSRSSALPSTLPSGALMSPKREPSSSSTPSSTSRPPPLRSASTSTLLHPRSVSSRASSAANVLAPTPATADPTTTTLRGAGSGCASTGFIRVDDDSNGEPMKPPATAGPAHRADVRASMAFCGV